MTIKIQATPNRKVLGNVAFRAYQIGDQDVVGGNPLPYYPVMDPDLIENGGEFKVAGNNPNQFLVYVTTGEAPLGGAATPIYIVNSTPVNPPNPPSNLVATAVSSSQIDLVWVDNSSDETGFRIYRDGIEIDTVGAGVTTYNDTGLTPNTEYEYYVTAFNANGESDPSNTDSATTDFVGAYDDIPNLVHVYEPARRTLSAYTGPLVRIRRSSDDTQQDFGYVTNGGLDVDAIATFIGVGSGFVVTVYDQVETANITQPTGGNQPTYTASGHDNKPVFSFPSNDNLRKDAGSLVQPLTVFIVGNSTNAVGAGNFVDGNNNAGATGATGRVIVGRSAASWRIFAGSVVAGGTADSNYHLLTAIINGVSSSLDVDNINVLNGNANTQPLTGIRVGITYDGSVGQALMGNVGSVIIGQNMTAGNRQDLEDAINAYWNLY